MITKWRDQEVEKEVLTESGQAVKRACYWVETDAKRLVHFVTTRLRGSTSVNWSGSGMSKGKVSGVAKTNDGIGQPEKKPDKFTGVVGTNVEYGRRYDMGFVGTDALGRKYNQKPRAYLRVALENNRNKILGAFKNIAK